MSEYAVMIVLDLNVKTFGRAKENVEKITEERVRKAIGTDRRLGIKMLKTKFLGKIEEGQ